MKPTIQHIASTPADVALVQNIGNYVQQIRISQNKTQAEIATAAGINRSTLVKLEAGKGVQLISLVQILRALNQLHLLTAFTFEQPISPLAAVKMQLANRQRASKNTTNLQH